MNLGTTFSHRHVSYLGLPIDESFDYLLSMKFQIIRLCCYWNEIQTYKNEWNFQNIHLLLKKCESAGQNVCITIGMKAPRWPEFYIPTWAVDNIDAACLNFVSMGINQLKHYECISTWQIENEPLDPSGPKNQTVSETLLTREVDIVKKLDDRPVLLTVWGNTLFSRSCYKKITQHADIIGVDIYYRVPTLGIYCGPGGGDKNIAKSLQQSQKPIWLTELQAEPWENRWTKPRSESMSPQILLENYKKARKLGAAAILLWGSEFWLKEAKNGNPDYLNAVKKITKNEL